ncbi:Zinc finger BED domain-containing protein RICESLEEPER 2 [Bienertia sinuspersici]
MSQHPLQDLTSLAKFVNNYNYLEKKLVLDCCTRWNATYHVLSVALEFKPAFPRYRESSYNLLPSEEEWNQVEVVCTFLSLFNEVTEIISGCEYPTSNLFLLEPTNIKEALDSQCALNMIS